MSQQARQGNTPYAVSKHRETTADGREFDKVREVGGAAKEAGAGRVQQARQAHHGDAFGAKGKSTQGSPGLARASNVPHTNPIQDCDEPGSFLLREPVPKQKGVKLQADEE